MVYLAAWKVATDGNDPHYVRLQEGAYASHRPAGTSRPCSDPSNFCPSNNPYEFSKAEQIAVAVILSTGGLVLLILGTWYLVEWLKFRKKGT